MLFNGAPAAGAGAVWQGRRHDDDEHLVQCIRRSFIASDGVGDSFHHQYDADVCDSVSDTVVSRGRSTVDADFPSFQSDVVAAGADEKARGCQQRRDVFAWGNLAKCDADQHQSDNDEQQAGDADEGRREDAVELGERMMDVCHRRLPICRCWRVTIFAARLRRAYVIGDEGDNHQEQRATSGRHQHQQAVYSLLLLMVLFLGSSHMPGASGHRYVANLQGFIKMPRALTAFEAKDFLPNQMRVLHKSNGREDIFLKDGVPLHICKSSVDADSAKQDMSKFFQGKCIKGRQEVEQRVHLGGYGGSFPELYGFRRLHEDTFTVHTTTLRIPPSTRFLLGDDVYPSKEALQFSENKMMKIASAMSGSDLRASEARVNPILGKHNIHRHEPGKPLAPVKKSSSSSSEEAGPRSFWQQNAAKFLGVQRLKPSLLLGEVKYTQSTPARTHSPSQQVPETEPAAVPDEKAMLASVPLAYVVETAAESLSTVRIVNTEAPTVMPTAAATSLTTPMTIAPAMAVDDVMTFHDPHLWWSQQVGHTSAKLTSQDTAAPMVNLHDDEDLRRFQAEGFRIPAEPQHSPDGTSEGPALVQVQPSSTSPPGAIEQELVRLELGSKEQTEQQGTGVARLSKTPPSSLVIDANAGSVKDHVMYNEEEDRAASVRKETTAAPSSASAVTRLLLPASGQLSGDAKRHEWELQQSPGSFRLQKTNGTLFRMPTASRVYLPDGDGRRIDQGLVLATVANGMPTPSPDGTSMVSALQTAMVEASTRKSEFDSPYSQSTFKAATIIPSPNNYIISPVLANDEYSKRLLVTTKDYWDVHVSRTEKPSSTPGGYTLMDEAPVRTPSADGRVAALIQHQDGPYNDELAPDGSAGVDMPVFKKGYDGTADEEGSSAVDAQELREESTGLPLDMLLMPTYFPVRRQDNSFMLDTSMPSGQEHRTKRNNTPATIISSPAYDIDAKWKDVYFDLPIFKELEDGMALAGESYYAQQPADVVVIGQTNAPATTMDIVDLYNKPSTPMSTRLVADEPAMTALGSTDSPFSTYFSAKFSMEETQVGIDRTANEIAQQIRRLQELHAKNGKMISTGDLLRKVVSVSKAKHEDEKREVRTLEKYFSGEDFRPRPAKEDEEIRSRRRFQEAALTRNVERARMSALIHNKQGRKRHGHMMLPDATGGPSLDESGLLLPEMVTAHADTLKSYDFLSIIGRAVEAGSGAFKKAVGWRWS